MKTTTLIMLVCMAVVSAIPFCITGCGNEPDDQEIRTVGDLKKWVIEEIGFYVAKEAESRAKFDREVLDMIRTRERGAYDWKEENVIERIETLESRLHGEKAMEMSVWWKNYIERAASINIPNTFHVAEDPAGFFYNDRNEQILVSKVVEMILEHLNLEIEQVSEHTKLKSTIDNNLHVLEIVEN